MSEKFSDSNEKDILDVKDISNDSTHDGSITELKKRFSTFSIITIGFSLTNSWLGISASLVTGIQSGGPLMIIYGILIVASVSVCVAVTLSEFSLAIPSAGGQYVWSRVLAPKKYSKFLAYLCGSFSWAGSVFTSASMALAIAQQLSSFYALMHPDYVSKKWQLFIIYQLVNVFIALFNCYGKWLPKLGSISFWVSITSYCAILITVLVCARGKYRDAKFVFATFDNNTGWKSSGIGFIVGLINPSWAFSCLDSACHLAEETEKPRTDIPKALLSTVAIGFLTAFTYSIAVFFCVQDLDEILNSASGFPILIIYQQAVGSKAGTLILGLLVFLTAFGCTIGSHTWQTRLCWSFARDNGLPFSKRLSVIHPTLGVPVQAHIFSTFWVAVLGLLYLASDVGFNSMVVGSVTFLLLSYLVPTISVLYRGRNNIKHGPFWMGKFGLFCNIVTVIWAIFALVFYSFPPYMPVTRMLMNYVSVVMVGYFIWVGAYWWVPKYGCKYKFGGDEEDFSDVCLTDI